MKRQTVDLKEAAVQAAMLAACNRSPPPLILKLMPPHIMEAAVNVGMAIAVRRPNGIHCRLCGRGPFTERGYYLHVRRLHYMDIYNLILDEAARISFSSHRS